MKFVFLMDPLEGVVMHKDTSFIFMHEAHKRGHEVYYLANDGIEFYRNQLRFQVQKVTPQKIAKQPFIEGDKVTLSEFDVDALFIRSEPPFSDEYLMNTWMLDQKRNDKLFIVNSPDGIRKVNEKVWTTQFGKHIPETVVTSHQKSFRQFLDEQKQIIAKPTDGFGGTGVFKVKADGDNKNVIFEMLSENGKKKVILQEYVPEAELGDKRILLLNGDILGAVMRVHGEGDHRNNFFAGGTAEACEITEEDKKVCAALKPLLQELGLYFVGIDLLGKKLIEVNVTSPTCLQEMNSLYGWKLEEKVVQFVENQITDLKCLN